MKRTFLLLAEGGITPGPLLTEFSWPTSSTNRAVGQLLSFESNSKNAKALNPGDSSSLVVIATIGDYGFVRQ
jgi:hypothetical protein